ncbi:putative Transcriptional regulator [Mesorhizobium plurifarium]|uniref:Putative Transcriptional regulator n=1 Tax=Mesorhizobium plurifarium TaxID=69974 RepID=A0A090GV40_MESPL|nr:putative Transcriptional regulator [Mesorhizobium plurifarium]
MLIATLVAFFTSNQFAALELAFNFWDPFAISQYRLGRLSTDDYEVSIQQALEEGDFSEAQSLVELAHDNGRELPADLIERTHESPFEFGLRNTKDFLDGAITGHVTTRASIGGVLAADYVGVGDVRDAVIQGNHLIRGEDYDKLTLGLSLLGLATNAPGTGAIDMGFSLLKNANKAGKLSEALIRRLGVISARMVDLEGLKRGLSRTSLPTFKAPSAAAVRAAFSEIDWHRVAKGDFSGFRKLISEMMPVDMTAAKDAFSSAVRKEVVGEVGLLASSAMGIASTGGIKATFRALENADDAKELSRFLSLARGMGEKTSAVVRVLGKSAIKLGELAYLVVSILIAAISWVAGALWFVFSLVRTSFSLVKRKGART